MEMFLYLLYQWAQNSIQYTGLVLRQENRNQFEIAEIAKWLVENV